MFFHRNIQSAGFSNLAGFQSPSLRWRLIASNSWRHVADDKISGKSQWKKPPKKWPSNHQPTIDWIILIPNEKNQPTRGFKYKSWNGPKLDQCLYDFQVYLSGVTTKKTVTFSLAGVVNHSRSWSSVKKTCSWPVPNEQFLLKGCYSDPVNDFRTVNESVMITIFLVGLCVCFLSLFLAIIVPSVARRETHPGPRKYHGYCYQLSPAPPRSGDTAEWRCSIRQIDELCGV